MLPSRAIAFSFAHEKARGPEAAGGCAPGAAPIFIYDRFRLPYVPAKVKSRLLILATGGRF
jgi:hypothetical protein